MPLAPLVLRDQRLGSYDFQVGRQIRKRPIAVWIQGSPFFLPEL